MSKCKCDKIFDTDEQLNYDETGECCCDNCFDEIGLEFEKDMHDAINKSMENGIVHIENAVDILLNNGYRKVK
jgi:hypothetical protein